MADLRCNPPTEMAGCHGPLDDPPLFGVDRITLAQQRCGLCQRTFIYSRKCPTWYPHRAFTCRRKSKKPGNGERGWLMR